MPTRDDTIAFLETAPTSRLDAAGRPASLRGERGIAKRCEPSLAIRRAVVTP